MTQVLHLYRVCLVCQGQQVRLYVMIFVKFGLTHISYSRRFYLCRLLTCMNMEVM